MGLSVGLILFLISSLNLVRNVENLSLDVWFYFLIPFIYWFTGLLTGLLVGFIWGVMTQSIKTISGLNENKQDLSWGYDDMRSAGESEMDSWVVPKEEQLFTLEDYCDYMIFKELE